MKAHHLHDVAPADRKHHGLIAVAFATLFTGITCTVHVMELSAGRQMRDAGIVWPVAGNMRLQLVGVFGYAVLLPILALVLMRAFGKAR
ncbi:MAG: hypothetical protein ABL982_16735 [Vicinamibacterales bacterium]